VEPKKNRSIVLIIRRFFAVFILFSTISGVVAAVETNSFNDDVIGGVFVSLLIIYYLARSPRKNRTNSDVDIETTEIEDLEDDEGMEELLEEYKASLEDIESEENIIYRTDKVNKSNPVSDKQGILSRIFQGKTDRY
jgi:hypothetical protein